MSHRWKSAAVASIAGGAPRAEKSSRISRGKTVFAALVTPIDDNFSDMDN
jgi:hypothetical protein